MTICLPWKDPPFLKGKPSINRPVSMAMLNNQRVPTFKEKVFRHLRLREAILLCGYFWYFAAVPKPMSHGNPSNVRLFDINC